MLDMIQDIIIHAFTSYCLMSLLVHRLYITEALYITLLAGVFKEQFIDVYYLHNNFDYLDMLGNLIGIGLFFIVAIKIK
jgi:hypothetical protein